MGITITRGEMNLRHAFLLISFCISNALSFASTAVENVELPVVPADHPFTNVRQSAPELFGLWVRTETRLTSYFSDYMDESAERAAADKVREFRAAPKDASDLVTIATAAQLALDSQSAADWDVLACAFWFVEWGYGGKAFVDQAREALRRAPKEWSDADEEHVYLACQSALNILGKDDASDIKLLTDVVTREFWGLPDNPEPIHVAALDKRYVLRVHSAMLVVDSRDQNSLHALKSMLNRYPAVARIDEYVEPEEYVRWRIQEITSEGRIGVYTYMAIGILVIGSVTAFSLYGRTNLRRDQVAHDHLN